MKPLAQCTIAVLLAVISSTFTSACNDDAGFRCGVEVPGSGGVIATCDRPLEICVCTTNSCARRELTPVGAAEFTPCPSGYRYVEAPFAQPGLAGQCVPNDHLTLVPYVPGPGNSGTQCSGSPSSGGKTPDGGPADSGKPGLMDATPPFDAGNPDSSDASHGDASGDGATTPEAAADGSAPEAGTDAAPEADASEGGVR